MNPWHNLVAQKQKKATNFKEKWELSSDSCKLSTGNLETKCSAWIVQSAETVTRFLVLNRHGVPVKFWVLKQNTDYSLSWSVNTPPLLRLQRNKQLG